MRKSVIVLLLICIVSIYTGIAQCEEYEKFQIKLGMHEKAVNKQYGMPIVAENLKKAFLLIPKKKALYKITDSDYVILYFLFGRIKDVTILENTKYDKALIAFEEE